MGHQIVTIEVRTEVSRHNDEQDQIDDALVQELADRIKAIAREPKYADVLLWVDGPINQ